VSDELDSFETEGVQAFTRLTGAVQGLDSHLGTFEQGLGAKVAAATKAAADASQAAGRTEAAATAARETALAGARSSTAWAACCVLAGVLAAGGLGYLLGERAGETVGQATGYQAAVDEKAAASWANTPSGRLAFALDQLGSLNLVATCSGQGWTAQTVQGRRMCYPRALKDGSLYGWPLP
jgi:hypothetical protein